MLQESNDTFKFKVGDKVIKPKGYSFDSTIVAVFKNLTGENRIVAEMDSGLMHIFNESQLQLVQQ
jgi:hypothetical protein